MITLVLSAFDKQVNQFDFCCQFPSLEDSLDLLNKIVALEHTLITAYIVEDERRTNLPVAAFDGYPVAIGVQALEKEWQKILSEPQSFDIEQQQALVYLNQRRLKLQNAAILNHQRMIKWYTDWIERTQVRTPLSASSLQFVKHYESQIAAHQIFLHKAYSNAYLVANQLSQLVESM